MDRLRSAWKTMTEGTTRTLKWMTGGFRRSSKDEAPESPAPAPAQAAATETATDKTWGERIAERLGHSQRTIGLAAGGAIIVLLWIGWTAYVWSENGSTAAIGVLISWPAALAAVMLVTAPFIGGAVAVRRHRAGEPVFAGAIPPAETSSESAPEVKTKEATDAQNEESDVAEDESDAEEKQEEDDSEESETDSEESA